jgi:type IV secretory pathway VirB10-like protein
MAQNFGQVAGQIIQRYANVVPTITLPSGKKMKVYFTSDVVVSPYLRTSELSWVQGGTR